MALNNDQSCTSMYDYASLENYTWNYGGDGSGNVTDWWTPTLLLTFGALLFAIACMSCCAPDKYDEYAARLLHKVRGCGERARSCARSGLTMTTTTTTTTTTTRRSPLAYAVAYEDEDEDEGGDGGGEDNRIAIAVQNEDL